LCELKNIEEDGAPTGSCDPEYARGFRYGQEYGIEIERERIIELIKGEEE
jgi:hypothetical protein